MSKKIKKLIDKYRPDQQAFDIGNNNIIKYKIKKNKVILEFNKEFDENVDINISAAVTGNVLNIKKTIGFEAKIMATKKF